jgi:hypothetical protein
VTTIGVIVVFPDGHHAPANLLTDPAGERHGLQVLTGDDEVKLVELGPELWMWVGDDKFGRPGPVNPVVARVCRFPGARRPDEDIRGTVVFTGPRDEQGQLATLSTHWSGVVKVQSIEARGARRR